MTSLAISILKYTTISLCGLYLLGSILFAPCEFVMVGLATDPTLKATLLPVLLVTFIYKYLVVIAIAVLAFLIEELGKNESAYQLSMTIATGIATILTPIGFMWMFRSIGKILILQMYQSLSDIMADPLFYDLVLATIVFLCADALLILKYLNPTTYVLVSDSKMIEIVPVKKYDDDDVTKRLPY
jgi:hypothetical protein